MKLCCYVKSCFHKFAAILNTFCKWTEQLGSCNMKQGLILLMIFIFSWKIVFMTASLHIPTNRARVCIRHRISGSMSFLLLGLLEESFCWRNPTTTSLVPVMNMTPLLWRLCRRSFLILYMNWDALAEKFGYFKKSWCDFRDILDVYRFWS